MAFVNNVFIFLASLPVAIWVLAAVFSLIDDTDVARSIRRISWRSLSVLGLFFLAGTESRNAVGYAFATVITLHLGYFWIIRWLIARGTLITESVE